MDRGVVILAPRENNNVFERELSTDVRLEEARHSTKYLEFIKNEGLEYAGCEKDAGYTLAIYLVSLGHVVLQVDDLSVIYLPKELEENQYLWLKKQA